MNELDRRKILACANSSCPFRVHPEAHLGGFCCTSCYSAWIAGLPVIHGPRCHQSKAAQWLPRAPPQAPGPAGPAGSVGAVISPAVVSPARAPILAPVAISAIPAPAIPAIPAISAIRGATGATPKIIPGRKRPAENLAPPKAPVVSRAKVHAHGGHGHVVGAVPKARGVPLQNGMHNGWKMWTNGCLGREMAHTQDFWSGDAMEELDAENMGLYEDQLWNDFGLDGAAAEMEPTMDPWSFPQVPPAAPAPAAPPARGVLIRPARRPEAPVTAGNAAPVTEVEDEVDPALAAVLELGLSEEPAPAEAELSEVPPAAPAPAAPPARGVLIRPAWRPEAPVTAGNAAPVTEVEDEVDPALAAVLGLGLSEEPAEAAPAEAELSEAEEQLFPEGDPVAKTSVASSMDYVAVREDATTKAEAAVNVGLARLADVKYLRRNFRKRPPCGFAFVPDPRNDLHSVCRRCLCVSSPFGTCTAPVPMEPMEPIEPMEEAHVAAAIDMDAEMAKLLAEINSVAEPTPDMPLHPRVTVTAPLNGTLL